MHPHKTDLVQVARLRYVEGNEASRRTLQRGETLAPFYPTCIMKDKKLWVFAQVSHEFAMTR